jgi:hypothetical protein
MAFQTILGGMELPGIPASSDAGPQIGVLTSSLINASNEKFAMMVQAPKTGNIRKVLWATGPVTTGATLDIRLETITATTGMPSGTLWGTNTNGAQVVADADDNKSFATQLTADAAVTRGQLIAVVIANPVASFGNMNIGAANNDQDHDVPYAALYTGSWTKFEVGVVCGFEYDDGTVVPIPGTLAPTTNDITVVSLNSGTTPDTAGLRFRVPFKCRVTGCWVLMIGLGDCTIRLVSSAYHQANATGILATYTHDKDLRNSTTANLVFRVIFDQTVTIEANTDYRLIVEPSTVTNDSIYVFDVNSLVHLDGFPGGRDFHYTTAKDPTGDGSWTNHNSGTFKRPMMGLLIDAIDVSAGGANSVFLG